MILWTLFRNSLPLQFVAIGLMAWAALGANNLYQRNVGASKFAAKVEAKADNDAKTSEQVRSDVAAGKRGKPDPHRVRP